MVRFVDEKGRVFGKISILDLVVVLVLVIAASWFAYAKFGRNLEQEIAAREEPVQYTIVVTTLRPTTADEFKKGGKVFEFKTGAFIGTIKDVVVEPGDIWTINEDGRWLRTRTDDRVDAYITIDATARVGEDVITVNGVEARVGVSIGIRTKWVQVNGNIMTLTLQGSASK